MKYLIILLLFASLAISISSVEATNEALTINSNQPSFEISNVKFEQGLLSLDLKNTGTAEATNVVIKLRCSEGDIPIRVIDSVKPEDSPLNINESIDLGENQELYVVQFNIFVTCREGVTYLYPFFIDSTTKEISPSTPIPEITQPESTKPPEATTPIDESVPSVSLNTVILILMVPITIFVIFLSIIALQFIKKRRREMEQSTIKICKHCGHENPPYVENYCTDCGKPI